MKELKCKNCSSSDLAFEDGFYVCKSCDSKFEFEPDDAGLTVNAWTKMLHDSIMNLTEKVHPARKYVEVENVDEYIRANLRVYFDWTPAPEEPLNSQKLKEPGNFDKQTQINKKIFIASSILIAFGLILTLLFHVNGDVAGIFAFLGVIGAWYAWKQRKILKDFTNYQNLYSQWQIVEAKEKQEYNELVEKQTNELTNDYNSHIDEMTQQYNSGIEEAQKILRYLPAAMFNVDYMYRLFAIFNNGRANTIKEAINIMYDDLDREKREREEAIYREEMRLREAQRAREEKEHAMRMEAMQREQIELQKEAQRQAQKQRDAEQKQYYADRSAASMRCARCANWNNCKYNRGTDPNCGAFVHK